MGSDAALPQWASEPCIMGIDEAGRGPVLGPMVYGCLYCARSYEKTLSTLNFADSKTLKEEKREELFENLKADESIGWAVDIIDPRELSAKMLKKNKINLNEISHDSAIGLITKVLNMGVLLTEVYVDTVGDTEKYRSKLSERFPAVHFVVAKKADSLYPVVSGASIAAKVTRDRALREWVLDETAEDLHKNLVLDILEILIPRPGCNITNTWYLDSQLWYVSAGAHVLPISKTLLKSYGNQRMKMVLAVLMESGN